MTEPKEFRPFHSALSALLSDILVSFDKTTDDGTWTWELGTMRATDKATGNSVLMTGSALARIEDGMIMEAYNHWDFMGLWGQLGLLPKDTFEQALQGNKVA